MTLKNPDLELALEAGLGLLGAELLIGLAVLWFGRVSGGARRSTRHAEDPPSPGSVPENRHQNIGAVSAR